MLMDLAMGAVHENGFGHLSGNQLVLKELEITILREPVEKLMDGRPGTELGRQGPPRTTITEQIPEGIEVLIGGSDPPACMHKGVVSDPEFLDLIFLAAHGADPA